MMKDLFDEYGITEEDYNPGSDLFDQYGISHENAALPQEDESFLVKLLKEGGTLDQYLPSAATGFNAAFERPIHGVMQPTLESDYAPEWLANASRDVAAQREQNFNRELERNPLTTMGGNIVGGLSLAAPTYIGGAPALAAKGLSPMAAKMLAGALSGGAQGASQYVNPGESRGMNALQNSGIGAAFPIAAMPFKMLGNIAKSYPVKTAATNILNRMNATKGQYRKTYEDIFKNAEELGIKHIREPAKEVSKKAKKHALKVGAPNKYGEAYEEFIKNPTPLNAHKAQSDLGKLANKIESSATGTLSSEQARVNELLKLKNSITSDLTSAFEKKSPELAKRYTKVGTGYSKDVMPYKESKAIAGYEGNEYGKSALVRKLMQDETFRHRLGNLHPELLTRSIINPLLKYGAIAGGGKLAYDTFKGFGINHE